MPKDKTIEYFYRALKNIDVPLILSEGNNILSYLKKYSGKYKSNGVLSRILLIEWEKKNIPERDKAIVQSAINYISYFLKLVEKNDENLDAYISNIKMGVADLKPTICRVDKNIDFEFLLGNTNTQQTSIQHKIVESLFYKNLLPKNASKYDLEHLTVPFLRTILESKIKGILGIDILRNERNSAIELPDLLKILPDLKSISLHNAYDPNILSMIMKWLNHFMHRNLRPESYIVYQILQYIDPLFRPGKITHQDGILFSINSSAFTNDIDAYHSEVENILSSKFPGCYIQWKRKEVSTIKKK